MELDDIYFDKIKEWAREIFYAQKSIYNPYFKEQVILNSDGFHHLQFSNRIERSRNEQLYKLRLIPLGLELIRKSGTVQEYRKTLSPTGKKSANGEISMKEVEYWGFIAIIGEKGLKVRTVLHRVGNDGRRKEIYWESNRNDGWLVFWIVLVFLLGTGVLFGHVGTKWIMEKECMESRNEHD